VTQLYLDDIIDIQLHINAQNKTPYYIFYCSKDDWESYYNVHKLGITRAANIMP